MQISITTLSLATVASLLSTVVADGTTIVSCNPLKATGCAPNPALATSVSDNFQEQSPNYVNYRTPSEIYYGDDGLTLTLKERFDNPSLVSDFYIMFGKVEVWLKSAPGQGIISSFYLQSDDLDEVDLEWFGGDVSQMQSNYFSKGDTTTYDRGGYHNMADPRADFHNYTVDWTEDHVEWYIDGTLVRTLESTDPQGFPQSPMRLFFGIWAGGDPSNAEGTIEWAGGLTDYSDAPFSMHIRQLVVSDYSSGTEYVYGDQSGTWESIEANGGSVNGRMSIAQAEFASLVKGNGNSSTEKNLDDTSSLNSMSQAVQTSSSTITKSTAPTSASISSSTDDTPLSTGNTEADNDDEGNTEASSSIDAEVTTTTLPKQSKTVSLKSKYLSSSTKTIETKTKTSASESHSSVSDVLVSTNAANTAIFSSYGVSALVVFVLSLI